MILERVGIITLVSRLTKLIPEVLLRRNKRNLQNLTKYVVLQLD